MIQDMLHGHETSCKPCADATFMKLDAVIDMAERLIPLSEEADQVALVLYLLDRHQGAPSLRKTPLAKNEIFT